MTNVLIPTDFSPESLKLAEAALKAGEYDKCNLVLFHAFCMPSSPFDLLGSRPKDPASECITEAFRQACKQLKDEYPQRINKIIVRTMQGDTRSVFRNFVEANDIDLIYCPDEFSFTPVHPRSINPVSFFGKCGVPVVKPASRKSGSVLTVPAFSQVKLSAQ